MTANVQKTPIARTLNQFATRKVRGIIDLLGKSLPASVVSRQGGIVTVRFEIQQTDGSPYTLPNVTVPMIGSEYVRLPIQPGCLGWVMSADAYLGGMSGLGGGTADLSLHANLSCLVWSPIGNTKWAPAVDDDALCLYGPDGVIIYSVDKSVTVKFTKDEVSITPIPGVPIKLNGNVLIDGDLQLQGAIRGLDGTTYNGNIQVLGDVYALVGTPSSVALSTHTHKQSPDSHGDTEQDVLPPTGGT